MYFISIYYKDDIQAQRIWANTKGISAIESGDYRLNPNWPGQLCAIGQDCAIPPEQVMPDGAPTPFIAVFRHVGGQQFQFVKSGIGFLEKWQILALMDGLPSPSGSGEPGGSGSGGGGVTPGQGQPGGNPLGWLGLDLFPGFPVWAAILAAGVLFATQKKRQ